MNDYGTPRPVTSQEWGRIFAHAWLDEDFSKALATNPEKAVKKFLDLDRDAQVHVHPIPPRPKDLTDQQLEDIRDGKEPYSAFLCC